MKITKLVIPMSLIAASANAATIFATETFEIDLGIWTSNDTGNTGHYVHNTTLQPAGTANHASGGSGAASIAKDNGAITSTITDLTGGGATESLTVNFDFQWINGSTTRRAFVQYSNDGGSSWFNLAMMQTGSGINNDTSYAGTVTITEGTTGSSFGSNLKTNIPTTANYDGSAFGSSSQFRFIDPAGAGADVRVFLDNRWVWKTL